MNSGVPALAFRLRAAAVAAGCVVSICLASCGLPWISAPAGTIQAGDTQNGKSVMLRPGQTLTVMLSSTYWTFQGSSNLQVLAPVGASVPSPGSCPPGVGCGTITQEFRAVGPGTAQVTASRVSCGEAMRCIGSAGQYQLTVQVSASSQ